MPKLTLFDGTRLAFQRWGAGNQINVLCVHGWMDNSNSFTHLGPYLADKGYDVVAVDSVGHGLSDYHCGRDLLQFPTYVNHISGIFDAFGWGKSTLVGHSMVCYSFLSLMVDLFSYLVIRGPLYRCFTLVAIPRESITLF